MTTHATIDAARSATKAAGASTIVEIDHATAGRCYICLRASVSALRAQVSDVPEIQHIITEHSIMTAAEIANLRHEHQRCERCHIPVPATAYSQLEPYRGTVVITYYCADCAALLLAVGHGEQTAMADRGTRG